MFSNRLKTARKKSGLTQEKLAKIVGVERSSIGKYESSGTIPSPDVLIKISKALNVTTDYLLGNSDVKKRLIPVVDESERNVVRIIGRDGRYTEKRLSDEQLSALKTLIDSLEEVPDDL